MLAACAAAGASSRVPFSLVDSLRNPLVGIRPPRALQRGGSVRLVMPSSLNLWVKRGVLVGAVGAASALLARGLAAAKPARRHPAAARAAAGWLGALGHAVLSQSVGEEGSARRRGRCGGRLELVGELLVCRVRGAADADVPLPAYATEGSAGLDVCAAVPAELVIRPGERALVPTGFAVAIPAGFEGQVRPRSGLALRDGITVANAPGTIDADYRGELCVILVNLGKAPYSVRRGERIAQLVIAPVVRAEVAEVATPEELGKTPRGSGGFGHTGR